MDIIVRFNEKIYEELELRAARALERCGLHGEGLAQLYVEMQNAVDTGQLRNSITHKVQDDTVYIGTNLEYAPYVELGTGIYYPGGRQTPWVFKDRNGDWHMTNGQRARPFLKPALANHGDDYRAIIKDEFSE